MKQSSGGRNSTGGGRSSRERKGGSQSNQPRPQKVIKAPQFEKVELMIPEYAGVRPSAKTKDMSEEERSLFVS